MATRTGKEVAREDGGTGAASEDGTAADRAHSVLRRRVIACEIEPGTVLTEAQLARDLNLGKAAAREALGRLAAERLVRPMARRGYEVTPMTVGGVVQIFQAWLLIAPDLAALIAEEATDEEKAQFVSTNLRWASDDPDDVHPEDMPATDFVALAKNPFIVEMTRALTGHFARIVNFALLHGAFTNPQYIRDRDAVLDAMARGDAEGARKATRKVVESMRADVLDAFLKSPAVLAAPLSTPPAGQ